MCCESAEYIIIGLLPNESEFKFSTAGGPIGLNIPQLQRVTITQVLKSFSAPGTINTLKDSIYILGCSTQGSCPSLDDCLYLKRKSQNSKDHQYMGSLWATSTKQQSHFRSPVLVMVVHFTLMLTQLDQPDSLHLSPAYSNAWLSLCRSHCHCICLSVPSGEDAARGEERKWHIVTSKLFWIHAALWNDSFHNSSQSTITPLTAAVWQLKVDFSQSIEGKHRGNLFLVLV